MAKKTAVVALGGNALIKPGQKGTLEEQLGNVEHAMECVVKLIKKGYRVVLSHGNGPQAGSILLQQETTKSVPSMPLYVCVAETQGMIGYMIQEALYNKLHRAGIDMPVITLITQVLVDEKDSAFKNPTKPIGLEGRPGYRIVPSPEPKRVIEAEAIRKIMGKAVVIACGGGGIPVIMKRGLKGIDAVIDKDLASEKLAEDVGADLLIILTDVDAVYLNYGKKGQKKLMKMNINEAKKYLKQGQFPSGSMGPKIDASVRFLEKNKKGKVIITSFDKLGKAMEGKAGTVIE